MNYHLNKKWSGVVEIHADDKARIRGFINQEIAYYNALVNGFAPWLRSNPEAFDDLDIELLGEIAGANIKLDSLTPDNLPQQLHRWKNRLFQDGKLALSDSHKILWSVVTHPAVVIPAIRKGMAVEFLRHHKAQADALRSVRSGGELAAPVAVMQTHDGRIKRHVQIDRASVKIMDDGYEVKTPYNRYPIKLDAKAPSQWSLMVLRNGEGNNYDLWAIDFYQQSHPYLTTLADAPMNSRKSQKRREQENGRQKKPWSKTAS